MLKRNILKMLKKEKNNYKSKITYDPEADAMYVYINNIKNDISFTDSFSTDDIEFGSINFDFDKDKKIIGIEILNASKILKLDNKQYE